MKVEFKSRFSDLSFNIIVQMMAGKRYYMEDLNVTSEEGSSGGSSTWRGGATVHTGSAKIYRQRPCSDQ